MKREKLTLRFTRRLLLCVLLLVTTLALTAQAASPLKIKKFSDGNKIFIMLGESVTLKGEATGGSGKKSYRFRYQLSGKSYKTLSKYSKTKTSVKFTPKEAGTYTLQLTVKDKKGKTVSKTLKLQVKAPLTAKETAARKKIVDTATKWLGVKEGTAAHRQIVDTYNSVRNNFGRNPSGHYTASYGDAWCDIFVSAVFIKAKMSQYSGLECGCEEHINVLKKMGCFVEDDAYVPTPGDIIFYDWGDSGRGNCYGWADHVGIVADVNQKGVMTIIEGNYKDAVTPRTVSNNARYIRGFGVPKYPKGE